MFHVPPYKLLLLSMPLAVPAFTACGGAAAQQAQIDQLKQQLLELSQGYIRLEQNLQKQNERLSMLEHSRKKSPKSEKTVATNGPMPPTRLQVVKLDPNAGPEREEEAAVAVPAGLTPAKQLKKANQLYEAGDLDNAEVQYLKFLSYFAQKPQAAEVYYKLGSIHLDKKDYSGAIQFFNDLCEKFADDSLVPDALLKMATAQQSSGQAAEAKDSLRELVSNYPDTIAAKKARVRLMQSDVTEQ